MKTHTLVADIDIERRCAEYLVKTGMHDYRAAVDEAVAMCVRFRRNPPRVIIKVG